MSSSSMMTETAALSEEVAAIRPPLFCGFLLTGQDIPFYQNKYNHKYCNGIKLKVFGDNSSRGFHVGSSDMPLNLVHRRKKYYDLVAHPSENGWALPVQHKRHLLQFSNGSITVSYEVY